MKQDCQPQGFSVEALIYTFCKQRQPRSTYFKSLQCPKRVHLKHLKPRKRTVDGLAIYSEEELGVNKGDAGVWSLNQMVSFVLGR
ncbi:hypothetical protein F0562_011957 [Nyssa sinensis]|uniref:Uncharacterized protein n=1 Tax=Nyssa sinensis TaxID=561372 RepID=A0A5J4ZW07_9ASTE|nr:hypothetical protein F0562_011957 [Nyssa sinensis]